MHRHSVSSAVALASAAIVFLSFANAADIPSPEALERLGLEVRWTSQATLDMQRDKVAHVSNDENNIYVQSVGGMLTVFDAENGRKLWFQQTGRADEPAMAAVTNKRMVLICAGPAVYGYDKFTGMQLINFRLKRQPSASPVMGEGVFYVPTAGGAIYAYSTGVLEHKHRYGELPPDVAIPHMWRFICNENIIHAPVLGEEALAFVSEAGNLHSVNTTGLNRGRSRFQLMLKDRATAAPAIADNKSSSSILMLTGDNRVFSVDLIKGLVEWTYPTGRPMSRQPIIIGNRVFVTSSDGSLTQFSRDEASVDWGRPVEIPQYVSPMFIGAGMTDAAVDQQVQTELQVTAEGVQLTEIVPGSPAATAGLRAGDVLLSVNGIPTGTVDVAEEVLESMRLRAEVPFSVVRAETGMVMEDVEYENNDTADDAKDFLLGVEVVAVLRDSPAAQAGVQPGDIVLKVNDVDVDAAEAIHLATGSAAVGDKLRFQLLRDGKTVDVQLPVEIDVDENGKEVVSIQQKKVVIPVQKWDVPGVKSLAAIGRFSVFGIDQTSRLVAFGRDSTTIKARVSVLGYDVHLHNSVTDQVYLISSNGELVCLREIGPMVRVPDLGPVSYRAVVKSVKVRLDDPIEATGTVVCELELPDGTTKEVSSANKGGVKRIYVREGEQVAVGQPIILISDDKFATYHQRPEQQPIDVNLQDGNQPDAGAAVDPNAQ